MAKAYFDCADCGDSVEIWERNRREAGRKAEWHASQGHICESCRQKRQAQENAAAAAHNAEQGLPELTGTEKQIAWAETIRREMIDVATCAVQGTATEFQLQARWDEEYSFRRTHRGIAGDDPRLPAAMEALKRQTKASWWIDNRDTRLSVLLKELAELAEKQARDTAPAAVEAREEATLRPEQEQTATIAEIRALADNTIEIRFPEKREDFRELVKQTLGYHWTGNAWSCQITDYNGPIQDRLAEAGNRLLQAGFIVRITDPEARAAAVAGDYRPERKRWIKRIMSGKYEGWLSITWPRTDDHYHLAKALPGSRYSRPAVIVPPAQYDALEDYAEAKSYQISDKAREALDIAREAHEGALVVRPAAAPEVEDTSTGTMPPATGEIDEALRD